MNYLDINRQSWNNKVGYHLKSKMYDLEGFKAGNTSLMDIELGLLGDIKGKKVLHLQCHFGQDSISMSRMGATVTGIDLSDVGIDEAQNWQPKPNKTRNLSVVIYMIYLNIWRNNLTSFLRVMASLDGCPTCKNGDKSSIIF